MMIISRKPEGPIATGNHTVLQSLSETITFCLLNVVEVVLLFVECRFGVKARRQLPAHVSVSGISFVLKQLLAFTEISWN